MNEPDGAAVRALAASSGGASSSALCIAEVACAFHRNQREGFLTAKQSHAIRLLFLEDIADEVWRLLPVSERILREVEAMTRRLPKTMPLRAGDAIHIATARDAGFREIWTNDRHLLAAAAHFGLGARTVPSK